MDKGTLLPVPLQSEDEQLPERDCRPVWNQKNLTTHTARHSFASVIALANNVSLPNVAKMLGHSSNLNDTALRKGIRPNNIKGYADSGI